MPKITIKMTADALAYARHKAGAGRTNHGVGAAVEAALMQQKGREERERELVLERRDPWDPEGLLRDPARA